MKIQNLAIVFLIITIPLILILSLDINAQRDTLKTQAEYDLKLSEATKEGIKAYEINTVDWSKLSEVSERTQVNAMISAFFTSLENKLNLGVSSKEYMQNYIPALVATMYDGYYVYAPSKVPINWESENGVQLYLNSKNRVTTDGTGNNKPLYKAKTGYGVNYKYVGIDENGFIVENTVQRATTKVIEADTCYKYILNSKIAYTDTAKNSSNTLNLVVNYTLDNRIYVYGMQNGEYIQKDGYLVYFNNDSELPKITKTNKKITSIDHSIVNTIYSRNEDNGVLNKTIIEPETLEEQIVYYDEINPTEHHLESFKYLYDIKHKKIYYDDVKGKFFRLDSDTKRIYLKDDVKAGDDGCYYKSLSVLVEDGGHNEKYKKIYQVLNGIDKGNWYINLKEDPNALLEEKDITELLDAKLTNTEVEKLGLKYKNNSVGVDYSPIYKDFSAINYYVEAYAFTNWINNNNLNLANGEMLKVSQSNDPEKSTSNIVKRKRQVIKENINKNLNLAISNYGNGASGQFVLPVLTENDWSQVLGNISLISFFQGAPIERKIYNGYSIATSTLNRAYVDPGELYFRANGDESYHRIYCNETKNLTYTGYRSSEYILKEFKDFDSIGNTIYYYEHDQYSDIANRNAETACYYCAVNKANYTQIKNGDTNYSARSYKQAKSYNEALARERYYQKEAVKVKVGIKVTYHENLDIFEELIDRNKLTGMPDPNPQEAEMGQWFNLSNSVPTIPETKELYTTIEFKGWSQNETANSIYDVEFLPGQLVKFEEDVDLYAVWVVKRSYILWKRDYKFTKPLDAFSLNGVLGTAGNIRRCFPNMSDQEIIQYINNKYNYSYTSLGSISASNLRIILEKIIQDEDFDYSKGDYFIKNGNANVTPNSVSYIYIDNMTNGSEGSRVQMMGNKNNRGKGVAWATFQSSYLDIEEYSCKYEFNSGHSFNGVGFMFNVKETATDLTGYMLSFNFNYQMLQAANNHNAAIFKFRYVKGNNQNHLETLNLVEAFDIPRSYN